jgi:hypothetical protein
MTITEIYIIIFVKIVKISIITRKRGMLNTITRANSNINKCSKTTINLYTMTFNTTLISTKMNSIVTIIQSTITISKIKQVFK